MGDRIVHDGVYDAEGHLVSRDEALRPLDKKGSKRFGRVRQRHSFTWLWLVAVVGLAGWGLWALADSIQHGTQNFNAIQIGEPRANMLNQMGTPCRWGHLSGYNGQVNGSSGLYYIWPDGNQWDLMVIGHPVTAHNGSGHGYAVLAKYTAYRGTHGANYCAGPRPPSPYNGRPWVPTN
jgi:hypothetical protein